MLNFWIFNLYYSQNQQSMKRILGFLLTLVLGLSALNVSAQTIVEILGDAGTTTNSYLPAYTLYNNTLSEQIYTSDEIALPGTITSIAFYNGGSTKTPNIKIYLVSTSQTEFSTTTDWLTVSDSDKVFEGNVEFTAGQWTTIQFDTPFEYDGASNLGLIVDENMAWSSGLACRVFTSTSNCAMYVYSDGTDYNAVGASYTASNRLSVKNQIKLGITPSGVDYCYPVTNFTVTGVTSDEATVYWTAPENPNGYVLEYKTHAADWEGDDVVTVYPTDTFYTITGLDPNTHYDVRVAHTCSFGNSAWKSVSFKTECVAISVANQPYIEQFEGYASYSFPDCWTSISSYSSSSYVYPYVNNAASTAHAGSGYLYLYNTSAYPIVMALPQFVEDLSTLRLSFWMKPAGTTSYYGRVEVGVMTDLSDPTTFTMLDSWTAVNIGSTNWAYYEMDLDTVYTDGPAYLVFRRYVESTSTYGWYFDDVKVMTIPTCEAPTELSFEAATPNSVTLKWNPGEASSFTVYYKAPGDEEYTGVTGVYLDADSTYTLVNLDPSTNYSVYVASDCGDGTETPCDPIVCATTMIPVDLPYSTDFGEDADQNWLLNNGTCTNYWTIGAVNDTANALYITTDGTTPGYTITTTSVVSAAKLFTIGDAAQYQISFDVMVGGESSYDYIKLFFAPETVQYPAATTAPTWATNSYSTYAFDFSDYMEQSTSSSSIAYKYNLTGNNVVHIDAIMSNPHENPDASSTAQVVFVWKNDGSGGTQPAAIISNVSISAVSCPSPENLGVASINSNTATVTWDDNGAVSWAVEFGEHGFNQGEGETTVVTGTPEAVFSELTAQTAYDVYVTSTCSDGSVSLTSFLTFTTPCEPLTTLPFTENFDSIPGSTSGTTSNLPDCWSHINHGTSSSYAGYPIVYNGSSYAASGANSLRFYSYMTEGTYDDQYAILPMIDPTLYPINTLQLSFDARVYSTYMLTLIVGVMSNPMDETTFEPIDTIVTTSTTYANYEIPFSQYTGSGSYIALKAPRPASSYNAGYVDNIVIDLIPNCPKPMNFQVASITTNTVDLTWTEVGTATSWEIEYGPAGFIPGGADGNVETVTTEPPYTIMGLTASTSYDFYIRANCVSEFSEYSPVLTVTTPCDALVTLPYEDGFDTYGTGTTVYPTCWGKINTYTSGDRPYVNSTHYEGVGSLYFYAGTSNTYNIAITPLFDESIPVNTLQATFMYKASSATDRMIVGVMTNPTDASTFVPVDTVLPASTASAWIEREVNFSQYDGQGQYIAFKNEYTSAAAYGYIDNLVIDVIPTCPKPTEVHVTNATTTSIELDWTENGTATTWEIAYGVPGFDPDSTYDIAIATSVPFEVTGLNTSELYQFYVRAVCDGSDYSYWSAVVQAATACDVVSVPYTENFNEYTTSATTAVPSDYPDDVMPLCWTFLNRSTSSSTYPIAYVSSASAYVVSGNCLFFKSSSTTPIYAVLPELDADLSTLQITFTYRNEGTTASNGTLSFGYMTNNMDASTFVEMASYPQTTSLTEVTVVLDTISISEGFLAFKYTGGSANNYYLSLDNILVETIPVCQRPTEVTVTGSTTSSLTLSWTNGGDETSWEIAYGPYGFDPDGDDATIVSASANPFEVQGLTSSSQYEFYVRALCSASDISSWSNPCTGFTDCEAISLPYTEDFNSYATTATTTVPSNYPDDVLPLCWTFLNRSTSSSTYPIAYVSSASAYVVSGNCLFFKSSSSTPLYAVLPAFDADLNTMQITFTYRNEGASAYNGTLSFGYMTNSMDASTFVELATYPQTTALTEVTEVLNVIPDTVTSGYLAFRYTGGSSNNYYLSLDNILVENLPDCPRPSAVTVTDATTTSVTLSWTNGGDETSWEIAYGAPGFDLEGNDATVVTANTNPFVIQNLTSSSMYQFYVRALCSATEFSNWSQPVVGATHCDEISLPYTEDFEGYTGTTYNDPNGIAPTCWTTYGTNPTYGAPHITSSGSYHYVNSGTNCMVFTCSSAGSDAYAALPDFNASLNTLTVKFWRAMESTSYGTLTVGYVTDLEDIANTFVTVATIPSVSSTAGDTISVNFTDASIPATGNICFHWQQNSTFYSCCIDDIEVVSGGTGPVITDPTVATTAASNIGQTNATLNGIITNPDNVTITSKGFEWKATAGGTYTPVTVTGGTLTYNLNNLTANTGYTYKAFITFNGTTVYGEEMTFTTLPEDTPEPCDVPTNLHTTAVENEAISIAWDANANMTSWNIQYRPVGGTLATATTNTNSYTISGLTGLTTYEIQVQANCGDGNLSDWTSAITVQTTNVGVENYLINRIALYPNPAKEYVDIRVDENINVTGMEVYDVYGKLINTVKVVENPTRINVSGLANGMYFVRVTTEEGIVTKSFVKR